MSARAPVLSPRPVRPGSRSLPLRARSLALLSLVLLFRTPAEAAEPAPWPDLSLDPHFSFETGSRLTHASAWALGRAEERAFRALEDRRAAGTAARLARTILFDMPVAWWLGVVEHEAFGHGGRARELGSSAGVHLGTPWEGRESFATFDAGPLSTEDLLRVYAGGSESNGWTATLLAREVAAGRPMLPLEYLFLAANRFVVSDYVLRTTPDPRDDPAGFHAEWQGGGDVANYLGTLSLGWRGDAGIAPAGSSATVVREWRRLRRQALWNALDPGAWIALWSAARAVASGDGPVAAALPRLAGRRFLPVFSSDWLPDGGAASLELVFGPRATANGAGGGSAAPARASATALPMRASGSAAPAGASEPAAWALSPATAAPAAGHPSAPVPAGGPRWFSFTLRRGRGPGGAFGALGAAADGLLQTRILRLGGEAEIWIRPGHGLGAGARLRLLPTRPGWRGLFFDLGVKSDGHWPGRPAATGPFALVGVRLGG